MTAPDDTLEPTTARTFTPAQLATIERDARAGFNGQRTELVVLHLVADLRRAEADAAAQRERAEKAERERDSAHAACGRKQTDLDRERESRRWADDSAATADRYARDAHAFAWQAIADRNRAQDERDAARAEVARLQAEHEHCDVHVARIESEMPELRAEVARLRAVLEELACANGDRHHCWRSGVAGDALAKGGG